MYADKMNGNLRLSVSKCHMNTTPTHIILSGYEQPATETQPFQAGVLHGFFIDGSVRQICLHKTPVLHRIYAAIRDENWGTVSGRMHNVSIEQGAASFAMHFAMEHRQDGIHFSWTGDILGEANGLITFRFSGKAHTTFKRNRIGFCVEHPMQVAGQPCRVVHTDGRLTEATFPTLIAPHQPFFNIREITHEVVPGMYATVRMEGDTFEMEDQRNWTDASFKTYCTPLEKPFPVTVEAGTTINQTITLSLWGRIPESIKVNRDTVTINLGSNQFPLPPIGLGWKDTELSEIELERLRVLHPSHLRVDLRLYESSWREVLYRASLQAEAIGTQLELAIFLSDDAANELQTLNTAQPLHIARWLIFHKDEKSTSAQWVKLARRHLNTDAPIGAGTDAFFTELNREPPPVDAIDFACYSLNPQSHSFDNASLLETLPVQAQTVISAKVFAQEKPIVVSPVTFKMRWNPNASGPQLETPSGELPPQVDTRQMSLFGAVWTLGSIKHLAESGVDAITYFETVGWLGVMDHDNSLPEQFPAVEGGVYPLYLVLRDVLAFSGGEVIACNNSHPDRVVVLGLRRQDQVRLLIGNLTNEPVEMRIDGSYRMRVLDTTTAQQAVSDPETFRQLGATMVKTLKLDAYAVACLDAR